MIWLYDNHIYCLLDAVLIKMDHARQKYLATPRKRPNPKQKTPPRGDGWMKHMQKLCKFELNQMQPEEGIISAYSTIQLVGDNALNCEVVRGFMFLKKK